LRSRRLQEGNTTNDEHDEDEFEEEPQSRLPPRPVKVKRILGVRITEDDLTPGERAYADAVFPHRKSNREGSAQYGRHPTMRELRERHISMV
jgi:hypothetical protein